MAAKPDRTTPPTTGTMDPPKVDRPPIFSLSPDLIVHLSKELDEDDLLALRMTCKELNFKAKELHLDALYATRTVYFIPVSLENLLKIAKHPSGINKRVRNLRICPTSPYINPEREVRRKLEEQAKAEKPGSHGSMPAGLVLKMYEQSKSEWPGVQHMHKWDLVPNMLTMAFMNLPNIQSIEFEWRRNHRVTRSEFTLLYPTVGLGPGKRLIPDLINAMTVYTIPLEYKHVGYWNYTMNAAVTAGVSSLEKISDIGLFGDGIPLNWFTTPPLQLTRMQSTLSNLRVLHITYTENDRRSRSHPLPAPGAQPPPVPTARRNFCKWIESMAGTIEKLRLEDVSSSPNRYADGCPLPILPKLKNADLAGMSLKPEAFKAFIEPCKDRLRDVFLSQCLLENPKDEWFEILKLLKECRSLTKFQICQKSQWRKQERFPDIEAFGDWTSGKVQCQVIPSTQERHGGYAYAETSHILTKNLAKELEDHLEADEFWDSITNHKWKQWPESNQRRVLRINRTFTFDDDDDNAAASPPQSPSSEGSW
ncbi:hypothetical protein TWF730_004374 [Orbilia blumenaviensis]|uniref:F-box domain-containing protein n=1 Tax=Orbilia blumenaviensis TaxID=1796055 RepID=A0AAV9U0F3_9PEZI